MEKDPRRFQKEELTQAIIGAAIEVHRWMGPGLLESAYQDTICYELGELGLEFECQPAISFTYKKMRVEKAFCPDLIVEQSVIVELKSVEKILPIHETQIRTYLKLTGVTRGLLLNFNELLLKSGIRRIELPDASSAISQSPFTPAPF